MPESGVKIFAQQAELLYQRGVAAARGGQKAMAEKLLRQAVKLNPQHEQAWLWLSGVLEKPDDVAFCLNAVLGINPDNERAKRGLALLQQKGNQPVSARPTLTPLTQAVAADNWWTSWRDAQTTWRRTVRALLLIPIVLIGSTLGIQAVIRAQPLPTFVTVSDLPTPLPEPTPLPITPTVATTPTSTSRDAVATYFEATNVERVTLQEATTAYRSTTDAGRTVVERATATKQMRDQVETSHARMAALQAPVEIAAAHKLYVDGLAMEREALDLMLEFYRSYDLALSNRAALRMQESRSQIATATTTWEAFAKQHNIATLPISSE